MKSFFGAAFSISLFLLNTVFWCSVVFILTFFKLVLPIPVFRRQVSRWLQVMASCWIQCNNGIIAMARPIVWNIELPLDLSLQKSYLLISNHCSAVDIVVLQRILNGRIPFLKFFLKSELIYVPLLGFAWWALDFPFMKRHSPEYLKKHPEKRGEDLRTTKKQCEKFKGQPMAIINFAEGTRLTQAKHQKQKSVYKNLLMPKAGGVAFAIEVMGDQFDEVLDVTIQYPQGPIKLMDLFLGRVEAVTVHVLKRPVPRFPGSYLEDQVVREQYQSWVTQIWREKDALLERMRANLRE